MVAFLGREISHSGHTLTPSQKTSILTYSRPTTVQQMPAFLGLTGYSRNHRQREKEIVAEVGNRNLTAVLTWTQAAEEAFIATKQALAQTASLSAPD